MCHPITSARGARANVGKATVAHGHVPEPIDGAESGVEL
jgi:hypothetical protein